MAIVVEHEKRKQEILQKSLDVFIEEGYEDATFQKIADRCGITRTTLYIYFKNKHEIFLGSIKELLATLEVSIAKIAGDNSITCEQSLRLFCERIIVECENNTKLFTVILSYLLQLKKSGTDTNLKVRRRVIRLRHHLSNILIKGMKNNEFRNLNIKDADELLYSIIESAIFRITVLGSSEVEQIKESMNLAIDGFLKNPEAK